MGIDLVGTVVGAACIMLPLIFLLFVICWVVASERKVRLELAVHVAIPFPSPAEFDCFESLLSASFFLSPRLPPPKILNLFLVAAQIPPLPPLPKLC